MNFPTNYKYTKDHEWAHVEGKNATIGVTEHAASSLGDIVFVELPQIGRQLKRGETFGVIESIKAVSDLYSPVTGKVVATNESVSTDPAEINRTPHDKAWLIKVEVTDPSSMNDLMDHAAYVKYVETLAH